MSSEEPPSSLFDAFPPISDEEWKSKIADDLGTSSPQDVLRWDSIEGISLPAYLRQDDWEIRSHVQTEGTASPLATPDASPANGWRIRQDLWHSDLDEARSLAEDALQSGVTDLGLILAPHVGRGGRLPLHSPADLSTFLDDLPNEEYAIHLDKGVGAAALGSALRVLQNRDELASSLQGTLGFDPIAALARGTVPTVDSAFALSSDLLSASSSPSLRSLSLDFRPYHEAGASAVQELAYGLGALTESLSQLLERGASLPDILPHLHVQLSVSTSYFVEIAKLRALRLLVPQVIEAFSEKTGASIMYEPTDLLVQAETSRRSETLYDPHVNMLRGTTEAMAAVIGGCDVLNVRPYDACFRPPSSFGTRIARNVQLILEHEAHFDVVSDPAAGAYYLEAATDRLAQRAWETFQSVEEKGGLLQQLREGAVQSQIEQVRRQRREDTDRRERVLVGTNHYPNPDERRLDDIQVEVFSCNNGSGETTEGVEVSPEAFQADLEVDPDLTALVEMIGTGSTAVQPLPRFRLAEGIEEVRLRTEHFVDEGGERPTVLLVPLGPTRPRSARATFARNVFGVAGFEILEPLKFDSVEDAAQEAVDSDADLLVLCSADDSYPDLYPALREALSARDHSPLLIVAGSPDKVALDLPAEDFIHSGSPLRETLENVQRRLGLHTSSDADA